MAQLDDVSIHLRLLTSKFEEGVAAVGGQLNTLETHAKRIDSVFGGLLAAGAGAAFTSIIKGAIDSADRLGDLSSRLGTTVEGLSRLEYAAKVTGVESDGLVTGLQTLTNRLSEAAQGTGAGVAALNELGLSATKLAELRPEQQFEVLADAMAGIPNQGDKVRLAMDLMGKGGAQLLQTMEGGSAAIRAFGAESDAMGATISTDFANAAGAADAAMNKLTAASTGLVNVMGAALGPTIEAVAEWLAEQTPAAGKLAAESLHGLREVVVDVASDIAGFLEGVAGTMATLAEFVGADEMAASLENVAEGYRSLSADLGDLADVYETTNVEIGSFTVRQAEAAVALEQVTGYTVAATDATKAKAAADREAAEAEKLKREAAREAEQQAREAQKRADEAARNRQSTIDEGQAIRESLLTEEQAEVESYQRRIEALRAYSELGVAYRAEANSLMEAERTRHEEALTAIEASATEDRLRLAEKERQARMNVVGGMLGNLSTLMNSHSKKAFQIGKTAAIANALVSGFEAVVHSYRAGAQIGGPVLGAAFAATAAAATAVQIQQIKSQQFGGGGSVTAGTSGGAGPGVYQPAQPTIPSGPATAAGNGQSVNIVFNGDVNGISAEHLVETIRDHLITTDDVLITQNSRNGQILATNF